MAPGGLTIGDGPGEGPAPGDGDAPGDAGDDGVVGVTGGVAVGDGAPVGDGAGVRVGAGVGPGVGGRLGGPGVAVGPGVGLGPGGAGGLGGVGAGMAASSPYPANKNAASTSAVKTRTGDLAGMSRTPLSQSVYTKPVFALPKGLYASGAGRDPLTSPKLMWPFQMPRGMGCSSWAVAGIFSPEGGHSNRAMDPLPESPR